MINNFYKYKIELIRHELGHWIVAKELGFKIGDITLNVVGEFGTYGHKGSSKIFPEPHIDTINKLELYLINRICVLYAGVISQLIFLDDEQITSEKSEFLLKEWGSDDNSKIQELIFILRGIRFEKLKISQEYEIEHKQNITNEIWEKCFNIIKEKKQDIEYLTSKIDKKVEKLNEEYIIKFDSLTKWLS